MRSLPFLLSSVMVLASSFAFGAANTADPKMVPPPEKTAVENVLFNVTCFECDRNRDNKLHKPGNDGSAILPTQEATLKNNDKTRATN